jgi:hypothetical protein
MLKRLLKFFKGGEEPPAPEHGGSYLDFLLEQARPGVQAELAACPEHDPLLLVIVQLLYISMRGTWSPRVQRPLRDSFSPPPAAPLVQDTQIDDSEAELVDESEFVEETAGEVSEDTSPRAALKADEVDGTQEIEPEVLANTDRKAPASAAAAPPPPPGGFKRAGAETTQEGLEACSSMAEDSADALPRADRKEVLQAGRVFLGMLIENDRLPPDLHLGLEETALARDLLVGYFVGASQYEVKAQKLLRIVEQKFGEGLFSQARILLQLFQTDRETRMRNDRNIFYEDMIQRLGIRRRHTVSAELAERYKLLLAEIHDEPGEEEILLLVRWLSQHLFIKLHLFVRPRAAVETWRQVTAASTLQGVSEHFLRYLPPRRWRPPLDLTERGLAQQVRDHLSPETLSIYVVNHIRACYFVLRAVGDTGLEGYLDTFFDWTRAALGYDATALCPELYRRSMSDSDAMTTIFQDVYDRHMRVRAEERLRKVDDAAIRAALRGVVQHLRACDINELPPGNYDFGALVFDQLMGVKYPCAEFAFKVHRLT